MPCTGSILLSHGLRAFTANSITDVDQLPEALADIEDQCPASESVEHGLGVKCVVAPTWNHENEVTCAIKVRCLRRRLVTNLSREAIVADFSCSLDVLRQEGGL